MFDSNLRGCLSIDPSKLKQEMFEAFVTVTQEVTVAPVMRQFRTHQRLSDSWATNDNRQQEFYEDLWYLRWEGVTVQVSL